MKKKNKFSLQSLFSHHEEKKTKVKFEKTANIEHLKFLVVIVKKGHGVAVNNLLLENGAAFTALSFAEGTKEKYVVDIFGGEEQSKEVVTTIVNEKKYPFIKRALENRFRISNASKGVLLTFDISSLAGVFAYKFISDYEGALIYGREEE